MKRFLLMMTGALTAFCAAAHYDGPMPDGACAVDLDKITHWAGDPEGANRAALVIQFNDDADGKDTRAFVWGFRWTGQASGEDMLRAVCRQSSRLTVLTQYTGAMGSTFDGAGIAASRDALLQAVHYDLEEAKNASTFDWDNPDTMMGQTSTPGEAAPEMVRTCYENALQSGVLDHPFNARRFGYPSYDYDCWQLTEEYRRSTGYRWQAGWYQGYWNYWAGSATDGNLSYSGLGMSSVVLHDGDVNWWNFAPEMILRELSTALEYEMTEFGETMKAYEPVTYPVDFGAIENVAGKGEKICAVVFRFNDGKEPSELTYGFRWSGGYDQKVPDILKAIADSEPGLTISQENGSILSGLRYDTNADGVIDGTDHNLFGGWEATAKFANEPSPVAIHDWNYGNPNAVIYLENHGGVVGAESLGAAARAASYAEGCFTIQGYAGADIRVYDASGRLCLSFTPDSDSYIHSAPLPAGVYLLRTPGSTCKFAIR